MEVGDTGNVRGYGELNEDGNGVELVDDGNGMGDEDVKRMLLLKRSEVSKY